MSKNSTQNLKKAAGEISLPSDDNNQKSEPDLWKLEDTFPQVNTLLLASRNVAASDKDAIVVLDTNALLLPFSVGTEEFSKIQEVYQKLIARNSLFVPARVIREYMSNRDRLLSELIKNLRDQSSKIGAADTKMAPILEGLGETNKVESVGDSLKDAKRTYQKSLDALVERIKSWRGDDPVTSAYRKLFSEKNLVEVERDRKVIQKDWEDRLRRRIPPGYKDSGKVDTGIGDFIIWLVILQLGKSLKRDLIFVTGEEKADWWVRSENQGVYPRPELIDEFRRESGGRDLRIAKLADILSDMSAPSNVVKEVREAETAANTAIQFAHTGSFGYGTGGYGTGAYGSGKVDPRTYWIKRVVFDYSENDGVCIINRPEGRFELQFVRGDEGAIWLRKTSQTPSVARLDLASSDARIPLETLHYSDSCVLGVGDRFLATSVDGPILSGRMKLVDRGDVGIGRDLVEFSYRIFQPGQPVVAI